MKTSDIIPMNSYETEFAGWIAIAEGAKDAPRQSPVEELRAEHHLMDAVLAAMEREARRLSVHGELRPDFWDGVVDCIGNFTHLVHRRKEEQALFPALKRAGLMEDGGELAILTKEHEGSHQLTLDLVDGVSDGDWEKVLRVVHLYLTMARDHLEREEREVFGPLERDLDAAATVKLRQQFDVIEADAIGNRDRKHYLDVARHICVEAGLETVL